MFQTHASVDVVGLVIDWLGAVRSAQELDPHVVIMDMTYQT